MGERIGDPGLDPRLEHEVAATVRAIVEEAHPDVDQRHLGQVHAREIAADNRALITFKTDASPAAIAQARDEVEVVRLRVKGLDLRSIARTLGMVNAQGQPKVSSVHAILVRALGRWYKEECEPARVLEAERLDRITARLWNIIEKEGGKGDDDRAIRAIEKYVQVSARRSALLGLDAPKQQVFKGEVAVESTTTVNIDMVNAVNEYLALVDEVVAKEIRHANAIPVESKVAGEVAGERSGVEQDA